MEGIKISDIWTLEEWLEMFHKAQKEKNKRL